MPYTCETGVKAPCLARVLKITMVMSFAQKLTAMASTEEGAQQMCKHRRSSNNCRQLLADSFGCGQKVWRPLCHGSWTMKQLGYGSAGRHAHDEKKDDGPQVAEVGPQVAEVGPKVAEVGPKVAEFAARQGQSQSSEVSSKRQRLEVLQHRKLRSFCCVSRQRQASAQTGRVSVRGWRSCSIVNLSKSGSSIVLRFFLIEFIRCITFFLEFIHCISLIVFSFFLSLSIVLPFFLSLSIVLPFFMSLLHCIIHSDSLTPYETFSKKLLWPTMLTSWRSSWMGKWFQGFQVTTLQKI